MENITHLWRVINFLTKFDDKTINDLRSYYVQCCRGQEKTVDLPKQYFGPSVMCLHCGSLWTKVKHRNRLIPGQVCSKSVKRAIGFLENDSRLSKYRSSLVRKCLRSRMNKMIIKCFACSKNSEIPCNKPSRQISSNQVNLSKIEAQRSIKKKKRRSRDKTAGLNISFSDSLLISGSATETPDINKTSSPLHREKKEIVKSETPFEKVKKMNKERLSNILKDGSAKKRNSLTNFLKELY